MMNKLCVFLLVFPSAVVLAQPSGFELPLAHRTSGHYAGAASNGETFPYVAAGGRLSLARVAARVGEVEPDSDSPEAGFVLVHGRDGSLAEVRRLEVQGDGLNLAAAVGMSDRGALVSGAPGFYDGRSVIARLSPSGELLWSLHLNHEPPPECDSSQERCGLSEVQSVRAEGNHGWAAINFARGVLRFDDGRTVRGERAINTVLVRLDLRDGSVTGIADTQGTPNAGMLSRSGRLVLASGRRARELVVHDATSLKRVQTIKWGSRPGSPRQLVAHAGGYALMLEKDPAARRPGPSGLDTLYTLIGLDAQGEVRFTRDLPWNSQLAAVGPRLYVATPSSIERRAHQLGKNGDYVTNGVVVRELDASGRETTATTHPGYFDLLSFRLSATAGAPDVWLSGVQVNAKAARLVVQSVDSPVARNGEPPLQIGRPGTRGLEWPEATIF